MEIKELIKKVKRIEIQTTKLVDSMFAGQYQSAFKGRGMEFSEVREYVPGDDVRSIDWNVTARTGFPHVKLFHEERDLSVIFAVDVSASLTFGSQDKLKSEIAAELCAILAFSAVYNNDRVGLLLFSDETEKYIPLKKGKQHVLHVIREVLSFSPKQKKTSIKSAIEMLNKILTKRAIVFIISDFLDSDYSKGIKILGKNHDVIAINLFDPRELELPGTGFVQLTDLETQKNILINLANKGFKHKFSKLNLQRIEKRENLFKHSGIEKIDIDVSASYIKPLKYFFLKRERVL